jgi:hypothetical protein
MLGEKDSMHELLDDVVKLQRVLNILHHEFNFGARKKADDEKDNKKGRRSRKSDAT